MPKIQTTGFSVDFMNLQRESQYRFNETNDCTVKALAIACELPYSTAHALLKAKGRKDRHGFHMYKVYDVARELGFEERRIWDHQEFISKYPGIHKNLRHVTTHHPRRFPKAFDPSKTYMLLTTGGRHVLVVKGGKVHDWTVNTSMRISSIVEIVRRNAA